MSWSSYQHRRLEPFSWYVMMLCSILYHALLEVWKRNHFFIYFNISPFVFCSVLLWLSNVAGRREERGERTAGLLMLPLWRHFSVTWPGPVKPVKPGPVTRCCHTHQGYIIYQCFPHLNTWKLILSDVRSCPRNGKIFSNPPPWILNICNIVIYTNVTAS